MKDTVLKVILSKKVAEEYIRKESSVEKSVTIYFSNEKSLQRFHQDINHRYGHTMMIRRGFDYLTIQSEEDEVVNRVSSLAEERGHEVTDF